MDWDYKLMEVCILGVTSLEDKLPPVHDSTSWW